ncbi:uncharacterized protein A4U43_C01F21550 [Asparagus officinalis]|uniref:Polysaccharide biosynthesis protein C-terminal domain-containing protein n=1 Tax=Asparagus officinalis TaxID=4686 RepID=A0A5P1FVI2_ASPOF|nr:uncharacterized protein A4U43_C01F21550 [Asparagus officinalis]
MEPLCSQAFGANQTKLLSLTLRRAILFLLSSSIPICLVWLNMSKILLFLGQDREIVMLSQTYLIYSIPDLLSFSFIHPLRIYLRSQGTMTPLTTAAAIAAALHLPLNYVLVSGFWFGFDFGAAGVAAASAGSNFLLLSCLLFLLRQSGWPDTAEAYDVAVLDGAARPDLCEARGAQLRVVCLECGAYELISSLRVAARPEAKRSRPWGVLIQTTALIYVFPSSLVSGFRRVWGMSWRRAGREGPGPPRAVAVAFSRAHAALLQWASPLRMKRQMGPDVHKMIQIS